ncbi:eukaryotic translation initiation factor 3 subunit 8 N-terminus-domain-containing protein [Immersiella caudata]|uniref:Eukaryotic translation initiation factor 3 subunit C n=1 Tax=Immersiella caudata TaxID=314043 RepID=A0AA40C3Q2_9PEZI|nr:eukaryotic translation initiation factor 3 subunit 8 N-terminus-domain-containing protein [Immersiella caudata]
MSRFFRGGDDSSSESSSDEEDLSLSEEETTTKDQQSEDESSDDFDDDEDESEESSDDDDGDKPKGLSRFLLDQDSSESEEEDVEATTKVKSAKDKRHDELEATITGIQNGQKINDWHLIANEFDKLNRQVVKLQDGGKAPKSYIKCLVQLEDFMNETIAKQKVTPKKMNATNARGLNAVKQKIKKNNKDYQEQIDAYRKDSDAFMESDEEEVPVPKKVAKPKFEAFTAADEDEDASGFETVGKGGKALQFTPESIFKHLRTILESRGKKNTDRQEQISIMEKLFKVAETPYQKIRVLMTLVSARFDLGSGGASSMPLEHWKSAEKELGVLLHILEVAKDHIVIEGAEEWEDDERAPTLEEGQKYIKIPGSIVSYIERLDDELTRSLQAIDPHTSEYIERLTDEGSLYNIIFQGQLYYEALQKDASLEVPQESLNRIIQRRLDHVYYKPAQVVKILEENSWKQVSSSLDSKITPRSQSEEAIQLINTLCSYLFENSEGIIRARAMLCQIYFLALHDEYYKARDMMLTSHLQENIANFDITSQILYNRTLVQVGLCAFRKGLVYDAQNTLQEICGSGRQKELLAQGVMIQRFHQVTPEQERLEKQRQLPFHMHINLELLECVYLTCSMLLEIPLLAQTGSSPDVKKRVISKTYRRMLEYHERQIFTGPPENTRDHVMQASKALAAGEWKKATHFIHSIKIWDLMPSTESIKTMLAKQIQEEGLRTYLFTYAPFYDTLAVETLSGMFELDSRKVSAVVSKMISHEELAAALDQVTETVIFRKGVELSRLQSLALTLSDKASALIETNERTLEHRTQGSANAFSRKDGRGGGQRGGGRGGGRGGARTGGGPPRQAGGTQFTGGALGAAVRG